MSGISAFLEKNKCNKAKICVVGDVCLDEYCYGKIERISPEAPIKVLKSNHSRSLKKTPGGAANVCYQLQHFNSDVYLIGLLDKLALQQLKKYNFSSNFSVMLNYGHVPIKRRLYDEDYPLIRWDIEDEDYGETNIELLRNLLYENFQKLIDKEDINVVILSDYSKGIFKYELSNKIINLCNSRNIKTIVDPKDSNLEKWKDCFIFKPNINYIKTVLKEQNIYYRVNFEERLIVSEFLKLLTKSHCVVTSSGNGIFVTDDQQFTIETSDLPIEIKKDENKIPHVKSVIGAGDCFCAILGLCIAQGMKIYDSATVAFNAASVYVEGKYNEPITIYQLSRWINPINAKLVTQEELVDIKATFPKRTWVFTNGCFDVLHKKHLDLLAFAKSKGHKLIVAINDDASVKKLKGMNRPLFSLQERMYNLANLQNVDFVVSFNEDTPCDIIKKIKPDIICKGGDYKKEDVAGADLVGLDNVVLFPYEEGISSSNIINKINNL